MAKPLVLAMLAFVLSMTPVWSQGQQLQVDKVPMKRHRKAPKGALKGSEDVPKRGPVGKTERLCRVNVRLMEPLGGAPLDRLKRSIRRPEDSFLAALLAASAAKQESGRGCCIYLRGEDNCLWWCCGTEQDDCQAECEFAYCEAK